MESSTNRSLCLLRGNQANGTVAKCPHRGVTRPIMLEG